METYLDTDPDPAADRLASELADVQASIALVAGGIATHITLTGLRFGRQVADHLRPLAASDGVALEVSAWPDDDLADIEVATAEWASSAERADA